MRMSHINAYLSLWMQKEEDVDNAYSHHKYSEDHVISNWRGEDAASTMKEKRNEEEKWKLKVPRIVRCNWRKIWRSWRRRGNGLRATVNHCANESNYHKNSSCKKWSCGIVELFVIISVGVNSRLIEIVESRKYVTFGITAQVTKCENTWTKAKKLALIAKFLWKCNLWKPLSIIPNRRKSILNALRRRPYQN